MEAFFNVNKEPACTSAGDSSHLSTIKRLTAHPACRDGLLEAVRLIPSAGTDRWKLYGSSRVPGRTVRSCMAHPACRDGPLEAVWLIPHAGTDRWKLYGSSRRPGRTVGSCMDHPASRAGPLAA